MNQLLSTAELVGLLLGANSVVLASLFIQKGVLHTIVAESGQSDFIATSIVRKKCVSLGFTQRWSFYWHTEHTCFFKVVISLLKTDKCVFSLVGVSCFIAHTSEDWRAGMNPSLWQRRKQSLQRHRSILRITDFSLHDQAGCLGQRSRANTLQ